MGSLRHENSPTPLELGWFVLCLPCREIQPSIAFYERLGLKLTGGQPEHGWAVLSGGNAELNPMQGLDAPLLNFRGADTPALAEILLSRGVELSGQSLYDPEKWPAELHTDAHGNTLPLQGSGDFSVTDPDKHSIYFDTVPVERIWHKAGQLGSSPEVTGTWQEGGLDLGQFTCALRASDPAQTAESYVRIGLSVLEEQPGAVRVGNAGQPARCVISLYSDLPVDCAVLFRGTDVGKLAGELTARELEYEQRPGPDGGGALWLSDPAGNTVILSGSGA